MMKKRMTAGALAALMAASLPITACAAQNSAPQPQLNTAEHMQYMNGYTDGTFKPNAKITRAEFVAILSRFPHTDIGTDKSFADVPKTSWAYNAVQTALAQGWISAGTNFRPNAPITRAETAKSSFCSFSGSITSL